MGSLKGERVIVLGDIQKWALLEQEEDWNMEPLVCVNDFIGINKS